MRRLFLLGVALLLALAGCGGASVAPAPTPIPLASIDLESLLIQPGDLPAGLTGAQVRAEAPTMFDGIPAGEQVVYQQFARDGAPAGGVAVFLYGAPEAQAEGYGFVAGGLGSTAEQFDDVGEQAQLVELDGSSLLPASVDLLFARCTAVVHIRFSPGDPASITAYAQRLDERLQTQVCREVP